MFRKSVSFFVLVALLWILLWVYIPDGSSNHFTISDIFRGMLLMFSFMAFVFALLMLTIRYKGVDIVSNLFPQAGIMMWIAKHAYQYSQPKTILNLTYQGFEQSTQLTIHCEQLNFTENLIKNESKAINLGHIQSNPKLSWTPSNKPQNTHILNIAKHLKKIGKNTTINVSIDDENATMKIL